MTSGVVHFRTKSPIDYEGNSMSVWAGEMATLGTELKLLEPMMIKHLVGKLMPRYLLVMTLFMKTKLQ